MQRKGTLLVEYKQRQKANSFQDRRFGGEILLTVADRDNNGPVSILELVVMKMSQQMARHCSHFPPCFLLNIVKDLQENAVHYSQWLMG